MASAMIDASTSGPYRPSGRFEKCKHQILLTCLIETA